MKKFFQSQPAPRIDVQALNLEHPGRYSALFEGDPPTHLGITLLLFLPEGTNPERGWPLGFDMAWIAHAMQTLFDYDKFWAEFVPAPVKTIQVHGMAFELPHDVLGLGTITKRTAGKLAIPSVVFFDADRTVSNLPQLRGFALATRVVERLAATAGSYEPASQRTFSMTATEATDYHQAVSDLYENGLGVWCRALLPLYQALRQGELALLEQKPVIKAMQAGLVLGQPPAELRFKPQDRDITVKALS